MKLPRFRIKTALPSACGQIRPTIPFQIPYAQASIPVYCSASEAVVLAQASITVQAGSRTSVTKFAGLRDYRFFGSRGQRIRNVHWHPSVPSLERFLSKFCLGVTTMLVIATLAGADTPGRIQAQTAPTCYCHCSRAHARGGCGTMCELPKFASRWWAKSCARTHLHTPTENRDAGPRLHHPDHAERAAR